jgi:circadian clock protein KaiB
MRRQASRGRRKAHPPRVPATESCTLTLFVSGASDASAHAIANVREICDVHLSGHHELTIRDINQQPTRPGDYHVRATPTLVKAQPLPLRMVVGDMSDHAKVLLALGVSAGPGRGDAVTGPAKP